MKKLGVACLLAVISISANAQMSQTEKTELRNRIESSFPEPQRVNEGSQYRLHMGLTAGLQNPRGAIDSSPEIGINVGFQPYIPFGVGVEMTTSEMDDVDIQRTSFLVRGTYNLGGDIPVLRSSYFGLTAGPMFIEGGSTEWSVGPVAGFDIPLQNKSSQFLSLGLQAKYLFTTETQDALSGGLALKYWY